MHFRINGQRKIAQRLSATLLSLLFIMSLVTTSGVAAFLFPATSYAKTESQMVLEERVQSYVYLNAISWCIKTGIGNRAQFVDLVNFGNWSDGYWKDRVSQQNAQSGNWWQSSYTVPSSYLFANTEKTSGKASCNDVLKDALVLWGYDDGLDFICDAGIVRANETTCETGSGDFGNMSPFWERFQAAVIDKVYAGETPSLNEQFIDGSSGFPGRYLLYYNAFIQGCEARKSSANSGGEFFYSDITTTKADGTTSTDNYEGIRKADTRNIYVDRDNLAFISKSCQDIANDVDRYATDYAKYRAANPTEVFTPPAETACVENPSDPSCGESFASCVVEQIGWIICPVINFMSGIVDAAYGFVTALLVVQPLLTTGNSSDLYNAWVVMRNLANIAFVIAFLIIIFSQLTSMGVSNYGVKKLLPRLVIAAILVNVSYWVCAVAVDLSNITGASMNSVFTSVQESIPNTSIGEFENEAVDTGAGWQGIAGTVLTGAIAGGSLYFLHVSALLPALIAAAAAIVTVFLVLTLRQALIILLVVIAPLAFVAYLLPNTEDLFTKWRKLFMTLLLMYPIIAGLFGASALAASIVSESSEDIVVQIMGALISILPLALTPIVMKFSGGVLNRFGGIVNNAEKGPFDRMRKGAENLRSNRNNLRNMRALNGDKQLFGRGRLVRFSARRKAITAGRENELNRANTEYLAKASQQNESFRNAAAGGTAFSQASPAADQRALASALSAQDKIETDEFNAASVVFKKAELDRNQQREVARGGTVTSRSGMVISGASSLATREAAIQATVASNDVAEIGRLWDESQKWDGDDGKQLRARLADSLQASSGRPAYIGQGAIAALRTKTHLPIQTTIEKAIEQNAYSPDKIASADQDELSIVAQVAATSSALSDDHKQQLMLNAERAINDPMLSGKISKNIANVESIREGRPPTTLAQ